MNQDCEMIVGPCTCGAWHSTEDVAVLSSKLVPESFVYFIEAVGSDSIKIGRTANQDVTCRMDTLQTGCPHPLKLLGVIDEATFPEKQLHAKFHHLNIHREWFRKDPELVQFIVENVADPLKHQKNREKRDSAIAAIKAVHENKLKAILESVDGMIQYELYRRIHLVSNLVHRDQRIQAAFVKLLGEYDAQEVWRGLDGDRSLRDLVREITHLDWRQAESAMFNENYQEKSNTLAEGLLTQFEELYRLLIGKAKGTRSELRKRIAAKGKSS